MDYKKHFIPLLLIVATTLSVATTNYNNDIENWHVYDNKPAGATINQLGNNIIFKGDGRKNSYMNGSRNVTKGWNNTKEHILEWRMKFSEKFKIGVYTQTQKGRRVLLYDYKEKDKGLYKKRYIRMGLGKASMNGLLQSFSRNLDADLKKYEPDNQIISVNGFKVQGSGTIGSLQLVSEADDNQNNDLVIAKAKDVCINKNSDENVVCMETEQIVYVLYDEKILYSVSTFGNWNIIGKEKLDENILFLLNLKQLSSSPLLYIGTSDGNGGEDKIYYTDVKKKKLHKLLSFKTGHQYIVTSIIANETELIISSEDMNGQKNPTETYDISKLPKIIKIEKEDNSELINIAKEHCLGEDKSTSSILCSNEKNIVYIVDTKKINFHTNNNNIYRVSIEKNKENIELISRDIQTQSHYPKEYFQLVKLENTPIYLKKFLSIGADDNTRWSFMYKDKELFTQHSNDSDMSIYDIHIDKFGKKLIFSYMQKYTDPYGTYTLTYDISNPNEMILINTKMKRLR